MTDGRVERRVRDAFARAEGDISVSVDPGRAASPGSDDVSRAVALLAARLPAPLRPLARIAYNYRWSWAERGPDLFRTIDPYRWELAGENPVRLLSDAPDPIMDRAARDDELIDGAWRMDALISKELARPPSDGLVTEASLSPRSPVAFLCAEFGVHASLPIYSGGLGILAGDVLKEASDRRVPMVGVGLLYREGYFHQRLDYARWQQEFWIPSFPERLPCAIVTGDDDEPLTVTVEIRDRPILLQIWRVDVGRVPLYLLDAERPENARVDRWITSRLYVSDRQIRLAQYVLLGVGGMRALRAMGIDPAVVHLNEGHAALAPLELARELADAGEPYERALAEAKGRTVFTTHTPVPAGNESYSPLEVLEALDGFHAGLGLDERRFLALGRVHPNDEGERFGVTPLGLRASRAANGVSRLHGDTARTMWRDLEVGSDAGGGRPNGGARNVASAGPAAAPIGSVTNGVHLPTWMAPQMRELLARYLGEDWERRAAHPATWEPVADIPDEELWAVRGELRRQTIGFVRDRMARDRLARGEPIDHAEAAAGGFDPDALTIGFARRVAAYKRIHLLIADPERAFALLSGPTSVQLALAGKSHPQDEEAKAVLQNVLRFHGDPRVGDRVAFVEDYDMRVASFFVRGCDLWLNLPRSPLEASGTSGMKAALNGGLNLSVLDGWWAEAYAGTNGWAIEADPSLPPEEQDRRDAQALYDVLEREVVPLWAERDEAGIPRRWIERAKRSLMTIGPGFCATRMTEDYLRTMYRSPAFAG
jgi:starch phosphorylase